jgi:D-alanine transaminase
MGTYVWDGEQLIQREHAVVDIEDRGYTFGDGIYEVFRIYDGQIFAESLHWERFFRSALAIRLQLPWTAEQLSHGVHNLIRANTLKEGIVYLQTTRGVSPRNHSFPSEQVRPALIAFTKTLLRPIEQMDRGERIITHPDERWLRCDIKSLNLLPNVIAKQAASEVAAFEAVLHRDEIITEGSSSNIAIVKNGCIMTHPANHLILHGITRALVIQLANQQRIQLKEEAFTVNDLVQADEAFLMSTTSEIMPIIQVNEQIIGCGIPGPLTRTLQSAWALLLPL